MAVWLSLGIEIDRVYSIVNHNYSLEGNGKWDGTTLVSPASEQVMWNTIFLLLYCEPLNTWGVTELIKDYVMWEDIIERKKLQSANPERFPSETNRTPYKGLL